MSVYQREGSPYWWFTFSIDGKRFRGSTGQTDERKARLVEAEKFQQERARPSHEQPWRLREVLGTYWSEHARSLDSSGDIFFHFEMMSDFWGRDKPILEITNSDILDYRAARRGGNIKASETIQAGKPAAWKRRMVSDQGYIRAVAPQTVNRDLAHLQAAMNWAVDMHRKEMPKITWKRLKAKEAPWRIRFASGDELARLLESAHVDLRPIILCAVTTGLRRENILSLQWHQVNLEGGSITLPKVKGDKPHLVRITPCVLPLLERRQLTDEARSSM
ncbi:MAG: tyrosine-type recombinase/integrase [Pseudomonadota bacterium]